jgi:hypothetical protein
MRHSLCVSAGPGRARVEKDATDPSPTPTTPYEVRPSAPWYKEWKKLDRGDRAVQAPTDQKVRAVRVPQRMRAGGLDRSLRGWNRSSPRVVICRSGERERHNRLCKAVLELTRTTSLYPLHRACSSGRRTVSGGAVQVPTD